MVLTAASLLLVVKSVLPTAVMLPNHSIAAMPMLSYGLSMALPRVIAESRIRIRLVPTFIFVCHQKCAAPSG
ncbi:hypothetical protein U1Q18_048782 [Sarracenia purpurea var. burkii]